MPRTLEKGAQKHLTAIRESVRSLFRHYIVKEPVVSKAKIDAACLGHSGALLPPRQHRAAAVTSLSDVYRATD